MTSSTLKALSAAAMLALGGSALAQTSSSFVVGGTPAVSASTMWSMSSTEDGRTIKVESRDGVVTAEVDGKAVPADRIERDGDTIRIKDDKGEVIYETQAPSGQSPSVQVYSYGSGGLTPFRSFNRGVAPRAWNKASNLFAADGPPPAVMIGVQLIEPDSSLRGHLGLKEGEATMVSAIYEGLPAAQAGLEPYDIIVGIAGKPTAPPEDVRKVLRETAAGKSVSVEVIHKGQKKTVTITPEKYDREKLDRAKVNSVAAAEGTPAAKALVGALGPDPLIQSGGLSLGGQPLIATIPGQNGMMLLNPGGAGPIDMQDMAKRMQEWAAQAQQQAEIARRQAEQMRQQMLGGAGGSGGHGAMQQQMQEMMKKMESMQKLLEQREQERQEDKAEGRS